MHLKRQKVPKNWPIKRKGTAFLVKPGFGVQQGLPVLVILRDILRFAENRKEAKRVIHEKQILLNNKPVKDEKNSALLFDTITIVPSKKAYRLELSETGKFQIKEIKQEDANKKVSKIVNKKILKRKKTQLNLSDGKNFISNIKCDVNDSVIINLKDDKIEKCLPLKEKAKAIIFSGKHAGEKGVVSKIEKEKKIIELNVGEKKINVLIKQLIIIE